MQMESRHDGIWRRGGGYALALLVVVSVGGCEYVGLGSSEPGGEPKGGGAETKDESGSTDGESKEASGEDDEQEEAESESDEQEEEQEGEQEETGSAPPQPESEGESAESGDGDADRERRRNPFAAATEFQQTDDDDSDDDGESSERSGPLRRYSYEKYRLAGLISETTVPKAMFIAPDRVGHLVKRGDRIGKEGGVVQDIRDNAVELELPPQGEQGRSRTVTVELREAELPDEEQQEGLSDEEQDALQRLLESEQGREQIRERFQEGSEEQQQDRGGGGGGGESGFDGLEPPE